MESAMEKTQVEKLVLQEVTFPKRGKGQKGKTFSAQVFGKVTIKKDEDGETDTDVDLSFVSTPEHQKVIEQAAKAAGFNLARMLAEGFNMLSKASESSVTAKAGLYFATKITDEKVRARVVGIILNTMGSGVFTFKEAIDLVEEKVLPKLLKEKD